MRISIIQTNMTNLWTHSRNSRRNQEER